MSSAGVIVGPTVVHLVGKPTTPWWRGGGTHHSLCGMFSGDPQLAYRGRLPDCGSCQRFSGGVRVVRDHGHPNRRPGQPVRRPGDVVRRYVAGYDMRSGDPWHPPEPERGPNEWDLRRARRVWWCSECGGRIEIGELHLSDRGYQARLHDCCGYLDDVDLGW
jgi:hypothetical protein